MKKINSLKESSFLQSNEAIKRKISAFDGIATEPIRIYGGTVRTYFTLGYMYLSLLDEIVAKEYPDYFPYYQAVMDGHWLSCANVIILKREYYAQYCQFLFGVLFRHIELMKERHILEEPYHEKAFDRGAGYLAEILTCVYIRKIEADGLKIGYPNMFFLK